LIELLAVHGTLNKVTHEKYELPTSFSEEAQDLVNSTLKKSAEQRPNILGLHLFNLHEDIQRRNFCFVEIRDHPFFSRDFTRLSQSMNSRFALVFIESNIFFFLEIKVFLLSVGTCC